MRNAEFFTNADGVTECVLCPNHCRISEGKRGRCLGRGRQNGSMILFNYAQVVSAHLDPIEKKPLYHFHPGKGILSVGTFGCNLKCRFCQNFEISQTEVPGETVSPARLADWSASLPENLGIAFTYNEPGIWYEYIMDAAPLLKTRGQKIVLVTNGYLENEPWKNLCSVADAMNIDLKAFSSAFYANLCSGKLEPVTQNIKTAMEKGVHVEITNLVVTGANDESDDFHKMVDWLATISSNIPLHLSRYFPRYKETAPATDPGKLEEFYDIARKRLNFVYIGNHATSSGQNTVCPKCGTTWIERKNYSVSVMVQSSVCRCGIEIEIAGLGRWAKR